MALAFGLFAWRTVKTVVALRRVPCRRRGRVRLHLVDDDTPPCSFFGHVVVGTRGLSADELRCVLAHEAEHVRRGHSADVLLASTLCCLAWYNPFAWLMMRQLRTVHELQADAAVLGRHCRDRYLRLLYRQASGTGYGHITNSLQSINIKNRIVMMNKKKTRYGAWKLLAALPVAAVLMAFGSTADSRNDSAQQGKVLLTVDYHKEGGKRHLLTGQGYNEVRSRTETVLPLHFTVICKGEGYEPSYGNWAVSTVETTEGELDGRELARIEKKMLRAVDRHLRRGETSGTLGRTARVKTAAGKTKLCFTATWRNGTPDGDADTVLQAVEVGADLVGEPEQMPGFPGGTEALYKYLADNLHYPEQAKAEGIAGRVFVRFVVEQDGSLTNVKVIHGIGHGCDEEVVRVVEAMPRWTPGMVAGQPVRTQFNLPVVFTL